MWQTMQSRIYEMNTIMRSLIDGGDTTTNYVPTMTT